jgi:broad-specificity NMP kinase
MIIHLNGWPGVGKKTIGSVLARNLRARLIHNHLLHDVAIVCAGLDDFDRWPLYEQVRQAAYASLCRRPVIETLVMTNGLCKNTPRELEAWRHVVELAVSRKVPLVPVVLEAAPEELVRRVQSAERVGKKLTDPATLRSILAADTLQHPAVSELLVLDVTDLEPEEAATRIEGHIAVIKPSLAPASLGHLQLR